MVDLDEFVDPGGVWADGGGGVGVEPVAVEESAEGELDGGGDAEELAGFVNDGAAAVALEERGVMLEFGPAGAVGEFVFDVEVLDVAGAVAHAGFAEGDAAVACGEDGGVCLQAVGGDEGEVCGWLIGDVKEGDVWEVETVGAAVPDDTGAVLVDSIGICGDEKYGLFLGAVGGGEVVAVGADGGGGAVVEIFA